MADKIKVTIDGTVVETTAGENLLQVCIDRGILVPHFCYHEALGPAGACRLCAAMVAPAADKPARLEMTCMLRAADGMVVTVNDPYAENFRKGVIEKLMLNHPHDCPVCDEGGECMLQDMTVSSGHAHRRTRFAKRTWDNQYLGPLVHHEMNRCITCYRCVRFYNDYALGDDFGVFGSRGRVYFGRVRDGVLQSEFSGNLIDVCPTGVFTNKVFRDVYARPWDLQTRRSVCVNCSVGCNVLPAFRHGSLRRIKPAPNSEVNRFFMCDRGRYGGEFVNSPARLKTPVVNGQAMSADDAVGAVAARLKEIAAAHGPGSVRVIGSPRASLEANAALVMLADALGGSAAFFHENAERDAVRRAASITVSGELAVASLPEMEQADFVLCVGGDVTGEAPMMDLAIRQAHRAGAPLFVLSPREGKLDPFARKSLRVKPGEEADILPHVLSGAVPPKDKLTPQQTEFTEALVTALTAAKRPMIVCSVAHGDIAVVDAAYWLAKRASRLDRKCSIAFMFPAANSVGTALVRNDAAPEELWADVDAGKVRALVVLERNLALDFVQPAAMESALSKLEFLTVIDCHENPTTRAAHAVLPVAAHYQAFGTFLNYEGRAQRFDSLPVPTAWNRSAGELLLALLEAAGAGDRIADAQFSDVFDITADSAAAIESLGVGEPGARVALAEKLPVLKSPRRNLQSVTHNGLVAWNIAVCFGTEELGMLAGPTAELAPEPFVELNPADAEARGLAEGTVADFSADFGVAAPLRINPGLAPGLLGIPLLRRSTAIVPQEVNA